MKAQERRDFEEELKIKKEQLKDKEARWNGGVSPITKKDYMNLDREVLLWMDMAEMKEIELNEFDLINPTFRFEKNPRWLELRKKPEHEKLQNVKETIERLKKLQTEVPIEIGVLKTRIAEIEKILANNKR